MEESALCVHLWGIIRLAGYLLQTMGTELIKLALSGLTSNGGVKDDLHLVTVNVIFLVRTSVTNHVP